MISFTGYKVRCREKFFLIAALIFTWGSFDAVASDARFDGIRETASGVTTYTPFKSCSAASGSPGYMPQCDKITDSNCTTRMLNNDKEKSPDSNGDCSAGQLKVQRFTANAERETVCLDVSACGSNVALCQRWGVSKKIQYSCVTTKFFRLGL